jgi:hypothetical protein
VIGLEQAQRDGVAASAHRRVGGALLAALLAAAALACAEVVWARAAATQPLHLLRAWVACFALIVPFAVIVALGVGAAHPLLARPLARLWHQLGSEQQEGAAVLRIGPLALAIPLAAALLAHLALGLLALDLPATTFALVLAMAAALQLRVLLGAALRFGRLLAHGISLRAPGRLASLLLLSLLALGPLVWGATRGTRQAGDRPWRENQASPRGSSPSSPRAARRCPVPDRSRLHR